MPLVMNGLAVLLYTRHLLTFIEKILLAAADLVCDFTDSRGWISAFKGLPPPQRTRRALQILSGCAISLAPSTRGARTLCVATAPAQVFSKFQAD